VRKVDVRRYAPVVVILVLVAAPLAIWAATSGGSGDETKKGLIVERGVALNGDPELVLSIAGEVNVASGASNVRVECTDANGKVIVQGTQPWPFLEEPGYPHPHVHQTDSAEKIEGARRCRILGTNTRLDALVQ
jgi:hypothetical protein